MYSSKNVKNPKNYKYWSSSVFAMSLELLGVRSCGECRGSEGGGGGGDGGGCAPDDDSSLRICLK